MTTNDHLASPLPGVERQTPDAVVRLDGVAVTIDGHPILRDVTMPVPRGVIFGLVGPNGAGKSTTFDCVLGLRSPSHGQVRVVGLDPVRRRREVHRHLGVLLQDSNFYKRIRVREAVKLFAAFSSSTSDVDEVLAAVQLADRAKQAYGSLSGGQRRRLQLAMAVVSRPSVLVLDEPTSGLDLHSASAVWSLLRAERIRGATVLLSTHDMSEAERECDLVAVLDDGRLVASGSPAQLMSEHGVQTQVSGPARPATLTVLECLRATPGVVFAELVGNRLRVIGAGRGFVDPAIRMLGQAGTPPTELEVRPASFEDFYLVRTGHSYRRAEPS